MKRILQVALVSLSAVALSPAANAGVGISLNFGNVSDGYSDGYYDGQHHWHAWRAGEWNRYRAAHPGHAHAWRHDDPHHRH